MPLTYKINVFTLSLDLVNTASSPSGTLASGTAVVGVGTTTIPIGITMPTATYNAFGIVDDGAGTQSIVGISNKTFTTFDVTSAIAGTLTFFIS